MKKREKIFDSDSDNKKSMEKTNKNIPSILDEVCIESSEKSGSEIDKANNKYKKEIKIKNYKKKSYENENNYNYRTNDNFQINSNNKNKILNINEKNLSTFKIKNDNENKLENEKNSENNNQNLINLCTLNKNIKVIFDNEDNDKDSDSIDRNKLIIESEENINNFKEDIILENKLKLTQVHKVKKNQQIEGKELNDETNIKFNNLNHTNKNLNFENKISKKEHKNNLINLNENKNEKNENQIIQQEKIKNKENNKSLSQYDYSNLISEEKKTIKIQKLENPSSNSLVNISNNISNTNHNSVNLFNETLIVSDFSDITEKLSNSIIYCREKEKQQLLNFIQKDETKTMFICGQPGTGKTSLILELFKNDLKSSEYSIKIYINCMSVHSIEDFYLQILKFLLENSSILDNIHDRKNLESYYDILLDKKNIHKKFMQILEIYRNKFVFLILLDEVDNFYQKQKDIIFYEILNIPYLSDTIIKLILISNNSEFDKEILPKIENRKIKISRIVFRPYTHIEIYEILKRKLIEINLLSIFHDESLRLISKKLANKMGDLRPAIEIVKNLILENKMKINLSKEKKVLANNEILITLKDVLIKLKQKSDSFADLMNNLTTEQKIVLLSIYFVFESTKNSEIEEKKILEKYKIIKKENFNSQCNMMDYREIIKSLCDIGIIENKNKAKGKYKIKYDLEDLELIFVDDRIFNMFRGNN